jgi:hypothetical protein
MEMDEANISSSSSIGKEEYANMAMNGSGNAEGRLKG